MKFDLDVLVIDDSADLLAITAAQLKMLGVRSTRTAESGSAAVAQARRHSPELILLDLNMPEMDGVETISPLAALCKGTAVALMTGADHAIAQTAGLIIERYGLRFAGILRKPFRLAALHSILQACEAMSHADADTAVKALSWQESWELLSQGALCLHYQPMLRIQDRSVAGVECLARLRHAQHGLLEPRAFLPLLEASAKAAPFTALVIEGALEQLHGFQGTGNRLRLSINVAPDVLQEPALLRLLPDLTERYGIDPADVTLEITETRIMSDVRSSLETLARLRLKGFGVSIDDFGVGSATLQQLQRIPCTELKIDREFVTNIANDRHAQAIVRSSIALGRDLGLQLVAEGVETQDDCEIVGALGCDLAQGFHFARPMVASALVDWLNNQRGNAGSPRHGA